MIKVYRYKLWPPVAGEELVREQMRLAHRYQNELVEIERWRRDETRRLTCSDRAVAQIDVQVAEVQARVDAGRGEIKSARAEGRAYVDEAEDRAPITADRAELRRLWKERKAVAKVARAKPAMADALRSVDAEARARAKAKRGEFSSLGLYWGTYLIVEQAMDAARRGKMDPRFKRWDGSGSVAVQIQNGMPVERAMDCADGRLRLDLRPQPARPGKERAKMLPRVLLRVGSDGRAPVWAEWPVSYPTRSSGRQIGRELPEGSTVRWARVKLTRRGTKDRWELFLTVDVPDAVSHGSGRFVGIDLGWRETPDGIRVATWSDGSGDGFLAVDPVVSKRLAEVEEIRSARDKALEQIKLATILWMAKRDLPGWMRERCSHIHQWRAAARFAALVLAWRDQRFAGDEDGYDALEDWRQTDKRLFEREASLRARALDRRLDQYRNFAAYLAERYETLVLEKFNLAGMARLNQPEEGPNVARTARGNRHEAAASILREKLKWAFVSRGGTVVDVGAAYTSRRCHLCGCNEPWADPSELVHTCAACGETWDRDLNGARNIVRLGRERSCGDDQEKARKPSRTERIRASKASARKGARKSSEAAA